MDKEEELLGMMAIVEEQQETIKQLAESTAANNENLQQKLTQQQNHLAKEHREVIDQYGGLFKKHLAELTDRGNHWLDWNKLIMSVAVIGACCLVVLAGTMFYLNYLVDEIAEAEATMAQLKAFNADLTMCKKEGKQHPCIRVMKSWGAYGKNGDIFIIDPK